MVVDGEFGIPRSTTDSRPFFSRFTQWRALVGQVKHRLEVGKTKIEDSFHAAAFDNQLNAYDDATFSDKLHAEGHPACIGKDCVSISDTC